jgi:uncharacterized protein (DUF2236 family)
VLNTITDSTLLAYDMFVSRLSLEDRRQYYTDSLVAADLFGIPAGIVPQTYEEFLTYMDRMMNGGIIQVSEQARDIRRALFARTPSGTLLYAGSAVGIALLPKRLRHEFGFSWKLEDWGWLKRIPPICQSLRRYTPGILCANPAATASELLLRWQ